MTPKEEATRQLAVRNAMYQVIADKVLVMRTGWPLSTWRPRHRLEDNQARPGWQMRNLFGHSFRFDGERGPSFITQPFTPHDGGITDGMMNEWEGRDNMAQRGGRVG